MDITKFVKFIIEFLCIFALAKGNLVTLPGQCPFGDLKPPGVTISQILDKITVPGNVIPFNSVAETVPLGSANNRTNIRSILSRVNSDVVLFTKHFQSTDTNQCAQLQQIYFPTSQPGVYDLLYQVAPGSDFVNYKAYVLSYTDGIFFSVFFICRNLPYAQYQFEINALSSNSLLYYSQLQLETNKVLEANNLQYLAPNLVAVNQENTKNCVADH